MVGKAELAPYFLTLLLFAFFSTVPAHYCPHAPESEGCLRVFTALRYSPIAPAPAGSGRATKLGVTCHGNFLRLWMWPVESRHSRNTVVVNGRGQVMPNVTKNRLQKYKGFVRGRTNSTLYGSLHYGHFLGRVHLSDGTTYYFEKAARRLSNFAANVHSVCYRASDVIYPPPPLLTFDEVAILPNLITTNFASKPPKPYSLLGPNIIESVDPFGVTTTEAPTTPGLYPTRICELDVEVDPQLLDYYIAEAGGDEEKGRLLAFGELDDLVDYANSVFTPTRFLHEEKEISGVTFHLNKVKYHSSDCSDTNSADNPFCGSGQFMTLALRRFAQSDHSGSCASLLFTYRQFFEKEVLGMSYVGGVCRDADLYAGYGGFVHQALNVGVVSFRDWFGGVEPLASIAWTLSHELGHLFGSHHDPPEGECHKMHYLMHPSRDSKCINTFSDCSRRAIGATLHGILQKAPGAAPKNGTAKNCFV